MHFLELRVGETFLTFPSFPGTKFTIRLASVRGRGPTSRNYLRIHLTFSTLATEDYWSYWVQTEHIFNSLNLGLKIQIELFLS